MQRMKNVKIWIGLLYLLLLSAFFYFLILNFGIEEITTYNFIRTNREYFINLKEANFILVSVGFILFCILWVLLQGFGSPVVLISGFIFGSYLGAILVVFSLSVGATIIYVFANFFFKDLIQEKFSKKFKNLENRFKKKELTYMIIYRIIGGIPFQISNLIPCIFSVSAKNFFIGSILGMMPQAFIIASLGSGIENQIEKNIEPPSLIEAFSSSEIYLPILLFLSLLILVFIIKNFFFKN